MTHADEEDPTKGLLSHLRCLTPAPPTSLSLALSLSLSLSLSLPPSPFLLPPSHLSLSNLFAVCLLFSLRSEPSEQHPRIQEYMVSEIARQRRQAAEVSRRLAIARQIEIKLQQVRYLQGVRSTGIKLDEKTKQRVEE